MKKGLLAIALMAAMASLVCGDGEVREIVVTATPEPPSETASPGEVATEAKTTVVPAPGSASALTPRPTPQPTTSAATPVPTQSPDVENEVQAELNRALIKRYVEEEQDAARLTNVMTTCAASAGIALTDRIKTGGRAEDQMSELILAGVLDNYDVLECTANEIAKEVEDGG